MSKNEKLDFLHRLLPDYYEMDEKELFIDRLRKQCFYETGKGEPIGERLKKIDFDITKFPPIEEFFFWLTYITLTKTERRVLNNDVNGQPCSPNQKLISYIDKINVDTNVRPLSTFFLIIADTLYKMRGDKDYDEDNKEDEFVKAFNKYLIFQHRRFESTNLLEFSELKINLLEEEVERLTENAEEYEKPYKDLYDREEQDLKKYLQCIYESKIEYKWFIFGRIIEKELSFFLDDEVNEGDMVLFHYLFSIRFFAMALEVIFFCIYTGELNSCKNINVVKEDIRKLVGKLSQIGSQIKGQLSKNVFLKFASSIAILSDKKEYHYTFDILEKLNNQFVNEKDSSVVKPNELDEKIFTEKLIDGEKTGKLLDYFIPDKEMRKSGDRNGIKDKLKHTQKVLECLSEQFPHCENMQKGCELKLMYQELYMCEKIEGEKKSFGALARGLYNGKTEDIKKSQSIMLKEKYIRGVFRDKGKRDGYISFIKDRKEILKNCEQLLTVLKDD